MTSPAVAIQLDPARRTFRPGETLAGSWRADGIGLGEVTAAEVSVLWFTEGKGNEDFGVHFFERITAETDQGVDHPDGRRFQTVLPNSPLSYSGSIVSIHWCVRVRVFLARDRELVGEQPFRLGHLAEEDGTTR